VRGEEKGRKEQAAWGAGPGKKGARPRGGEKKAGFGWAARKKRRRKRKKGSGPGPIRKRERKRIIFKFI
jgi:hypothetical protein